MIVALTPGAELPIGLPVRHPTPADTEALAALMLDAYQGTVDADGSETLDEARAEVSGYFSAASGEPMLEHSFVAVDDDAPASAVLVSRHDGMPLIAYAMTAAGHKGRGLATALTVRSLASLNAAGERQAHLWATQGNTHAERIYERLGFRDAADEVGP
jgi:ribosomal protein S18 acetylase RimI-like enzyme